MIYDKEFKYKGEDVTVLYQVETQYTDQEIPYSSVEIESITTFDGFKLTLSAKEIQNLEDWLGNIHDERLRA